MASTRNIFVLDVEKGPEGILRYPQEKNRSSMDGFLTGLPEREM
ncbi:hypothetical protein [Deinococcus radiophilus]|nr:hypothetical protein [Deinococcus radiophilus]